MSNESEILKESTEKYECMLTTFDNPYDPFEEFDQWRLFDLEKGYNSCEYLARIAVTPDELSDNEVRIEIERAIDEIIKYDFLNIRKKVKRKLEENDENEDFNDDSEVSLSSN